MSAPLPVLSFVAAAAASLAAAAAAAAAACVPALALELFVSCWEEPHLGRAELCA